jgi:hypothetical protein
MKLLLLTIVGLFATVSTQEKYADVSDSVTDMLLSLTSKGTGFNSVHSKFGALASTMDSKSKASSKDVQSSVLDLLNGIEKHA